MSRVRLILDLDLSTVHPRFSSSSQSYVTGFISSAGKSHSPSTRPRRRKSRNGWRTSRSASLISLQKVTDDDDDDDDGVEIDGTNPKVRR